MIAVLTIIIYKYGIDTSNDWIPIAKTTELWNLVNFNYENISVYHFTSQLNATIRVQNIWYMLLIASE